MKILVTGGTGLVGKAIQELISTDGKSTDGKSTDNIEWVFVGSIDADLSSESESRKLFETVKPTKVIHLAAVVGGLYKNMENNVDFYQENSIINQNVLSLSHEFGVEKVVSCLSTCIFPNKVNYPIDETMLHYGPPHESNNGYAYSKRMIDVMNNLYNKQYRCNFTSVIPTNVYGPNDNFDINSGHVIPALIHKCYLAKRDNTPFIIAGSGIALRQFIYVKDLARLIVWAMCEYEETTPLILSPSEEVTILHAAMCIADATKFTGEIVFDTSKSDGQYKKTASNKKLSSHLPNFDFVKFDEGIRETVEWFTVNYRDSPQKS